jgi:DNA-binding beta-propeller fold protein YncE
LRVVTVPPSQTGINFARSIIQVTNPRGMVSDGARNHLFVVNALNSATTTVFAETSGLLSLLSTISLGQSPATGVGLLNSKVYAVNWGTLSSPSSVSVIDAATLLKIKDISISACGGDAANLAVNPATGHIYVTLHAGLGQVALIDTTSADSVTCIPTNAGAFGVAVHAASNSIFVGNRDGLDLWRVDGVTNVVARVVDWRTPTNGGSPYHVSVSPTTNKLFVMVGLSNPDVPDQLFVYDIGSSGELTPAVGSPVTVGNTGDGGYVLQSQSVCPSAPNLIYIAANALNEVWVLNSDLSLRKRLTSADGIGKKPLALTENTALKQVYIANTQSNTINLLNACDATLVQ